MFVCLLSIVTTTKLSTHFELKTAFSNFYFKNLAVFLFPEKKPAARNTWFTVREKPKRTVSGFSARTVTTTSAEHWEKRTSLTKKKKKAKFYPQKFQGNEIVVPPTLFGLSDRWCSRSEVPQDDSSHQQILRHNKSGDWKNCRFRRKMLAKFLPLPQKKKKCFMTPCHVNIGSICHIKTNINVTSPKWRRYSDWNRRCLFPLPNAFMNHF